MTPMLRRIVTSDSHGDLIGLTAILQHAGLINDKRDWIGEGSCLIHLGDAIDRGPDSAGTFYLLRELQQADHNVVRLVGNHELLLLQGIRVYAPYKEALHIRESIAADVRDGRLLAAYTDGIRVYSHAGIRFELREILMRELLAKKRSRSDPDISLQGLTDYINELFRTLCAAGDLQDHPIFNVDFARGGDSAVGGLFWGDFRYLLFSPPSQQTFPQVIGHTPVGKPALGYTADLRLINTDAGLCKHYGGHRAYLEITGSDDLFQHAVIDGQWTRTRLVKG